MPQVADESVSILARPQGQALPLRPTAPPRQHKFSLLGYLRGLISPTRRVCMRRGRQGAPRLHDCERPVDTLARKHPYLFIEAVSS